MRCPNLLTWTFSSCIADDTPYVPSIYELREFCNNKRHRRCPLYTGSAEDQQGVLSGAGVNEERNS